jgi:hypothetical protein
VPIIRLNGHCSNAILKTEIAKNVRDYKDGQKGWGNLEAEQKPNE